MATMGNLSERTWGDILSRIRGQHPELFRSWFNTLEPIDMEAGTIHVRATNTVQHRYLTQECRTAFRQAAQDIIKRLVTVAFIPPPVGPEEEEPLSFELADQVVLSEDFTFGNFVIGPNNRLAHAACVAVAENPGRVYNPLFIHGSVGLGKSHLLQAVCHQIRQTQPDARILYLSCETFTNHFIEAIERGALHQFRYHYRHVDTLIVDDIQFLGKGERTREEFFHTFNTLYQSHKQIILSPDESPANIPTLEDRLVSRFNWGVVARIDSPCLETRMAILQKKARLRCVTIPDDVIHYVASNVTGNIRELEGALSHLIIASQSFGGLVDMSVARSAVGEHTPPAPRVVVVQSILDAVTEHFSVRLADLQGKRRNRSFAFPRQVCMYLARELTSLSYEEIGGYFGGRDHSTVLHAHRTILDQRGKDQQLESTLITLFRKLGQAG